jgi:hypothetical protein
MLAISTWRSLNICVLPSQLTVTETPCFAKESLRFGAGKDGCQPLSKGCEACAGHVCQQLLHPHGDVWRTAVAPAAAAAAAALAKTRAPQTERHGTLHFKRGKLLASKP